MIHVFAPRKWFFLLQVDNAMSKILFPKILVFLTLNSTLIAHVPCTENATSMFLYNLFFHIFSRTYLLFSNISSYLRFFCGINYFVLNRAHIIVGLVLIKPMVVILLMHITKLVFMLALTLVASMERLCLVRYYIKIFGFSSEKKNI